ncbi:MAG: carbohydrate ABC transporter permease [Bacilli bacterium]
MADEQASHRAAARRKRDRGCGKRLLGFGRAEDCSTTTREGDFPVLDRSSIRKANGSKPSGGRTLLRWRRSVLAWLLAIPTLIVFAIFIWQPIVSEVYDSFFNLQGFAPSNFIGLQNYTNVMQNTTFVQTLFNTVWYVLWSLIIGWPVPIITALLINEMRRFQGFFKFAVYFPAMIPSIASYMLWEFVYDASPRGLLNLLLHALGFPPSQWLQNAGLTIPLIVVTMTWAGFGGTTLLYLASLQGVNPELYEAASIDGAGVFRRLWHVAIPQIASVILILVVLQIIGVFQTYLQPMVMTGGGPNNASMTLLLQSYDYAFRYFQVGKSMAIGVMTLVILLGVSALYFRLAKKFD